MNSDLDALATRLYVTIDDLLIDHPDWAPERPTIGIATKLTDGPAFGVHRSGLEQATCS